MQSSTLIGCGNSHACSLAAWGWWLVLRSESLTNYHVSSPGVNSPHGGTRTVKLRNRKVESSSPGPLAREWQIEVAINPRRQSLGLPLESALCGPHMVIMGRLGWRRCVKCAPPRGPELCGCYYSRLLYALMSGPSGEQTSLTQGCIRLFLLGH